MSINLYNFTPIVGAKFGVHYSTGYRHSTFHVEGEIVAATAKRFVVEFRKHPDAEPQRIAFHASQYSGWNEPKTKSWEGRWHLISLVELAQLNRNEAAQDHYRGSIGPAALQADDLAARLGMLKRNQYSTGLAEETKADLLKLAQQVLAAVEALPIRDGK